MPTRLIREGILTSERIDQLDAPAEVFYRRLMSKVDDHGLYDGRASILRSSLYPLRVDRVREADISRWIAACEKAGLIALYQHDGKPYLQMLDTRWATRSEPKYPVPSIRHQPAVIESNGKQLQTPVLLDVFGVGDVEETCSPSASDLVFEDFWKAYPRKVGKDAARKAFDKRKPDRQLLGRMLSAINAQAGSEAWRKDGGRFIPHPSTWLNEGRWLDEVVAVAAPVVELYKAPPPPTPEERAAANKAREAAMSSLRNITPRISA